MASPGTIRLLTALWDDSLDEIRPALHGASGEIAYPDADEFLDERDGETFDVLETLAERELLHREFQEKQYICPRCETKEMQYTTACPSCESPQTIRTDLYRHPDCGYEGVREQFVEADTTICPECRTELDSLQHLESDAANVCEDCEEIFETLEHRLRCRECYFVFPPLETIERVLYRYYLSDRGAEWLADQLTARQQVAEIFEDRKLKTEIDTTVTDQNGEEVPVHVFAQDELLNDRVVAAVHERPDADDVMKLRSVASNVDARATLVTTSGSVVGENISDLVAGDGMAVLSLRNGTLEREYEVTDDADVRNSFVGRIADIFKPQNG
ncbi:TackOD1 domain-containing metal-binding protein [Haladaptatus sp. NG-SE-30]